MPRAPRRLLPLLLVPLAALLAAQGDEPELAPLAGGEDPAVLAFEVRERGAGPIPARLTFVPEDGGTPRLFPNTDAQPHELAARDNVVYSRSGRGRITVPPGRYTVFASRGLEWSLDSHELELRPGATHALRAELVHELDTTGWISADFHLHTLTHSGHGDANLEERVLSFLGEGLELAVATDHNHNTDYRPTMRALQVEDALQTMTGNEVSTAIGHFNAYPLDPGRAPVDPSGTEAGPLFARIRAETNPYGVVPVIQLNHPRLSGIDYFTRTGLDPVTGTSADPAYSSDFDAIEILNENLALGFHDPVADGRDTHGHLHSALVDWFHLLNAGARYAAVGNSDSHHVRAIVAGYPRNFVRSPTDDPTAIDPGAVAEAVRARRLFTTTGPFLEYELVGAGAAAAPMGGEARAEDGHARLHVRVTAASWVGCDRVDVYLNGERAARLAVPPSREVLRLDEQVELCLRGTCERHGRARAGPEAFDAWVTVVAEGDGSLAPLLSADARPLALGNPIWIDGDGDGRWTSPRERVAEALRLQATPAHAARWFAGLPREEKRLALELVPRGPFAAVLIGAGIADPERDVVLAAARASEHNTLAGPLPEVLRLWREDTGDPFLDAILVRVIALARPVDAVASLEGYLRRYGATTVRRYSHELLPLFPGGHVSAWQVLGPVAAGPEAEPPPAEPPAPEAGLAARDGTARGWSAPPAAAADGYVDLVGLGGEDTDHVRVFAQSFLHAERAGSVLCAFGSDDGSRVWLDGALVYEDRRPKSADPLEALIPLELHAGWNRLVVEVENVTGGFGFYCRLLDPSVRAATAPR